MKIVRAIDCRTTRWKNGGGSTTEIAVEPPDASLESFDWRISMAQVGSDGPFSEFPGIDRTLAVVRGRGLLLAIGTAPPLELQRGSEPIRFAGDVPTTARLLAGQIADLNIMTRRTRYGHRLLRIQEPISSDFDGDDVAVIISLDGTTRVISRHIAVTLDHGDAAVLNRTDNVAFEITPPVSGECFLVLLRAR